jgi:hypothetical protein
MNWAELFYLVATGEGKWAVHHQVTGELAGRIRRIGPGFSAKDDSAHDIGDFPSIEAALSSLYEAA